MIDQKTIRPIETVRILLASDNRVELTSFLESLSSTQLVYLMSRLHKDEQQNLLTLLHPEDAAYVIEELPDAQAVDIIEDMDVGDAAAIINEMMSDEQADLIMELHEKDAEAILTEMNPVEAAGLRKLIEYDPETAGGLMLTEYISYKETTTVKEVIEDLRKNAEKYKYYHVRYIYVLSKQGVFLGVLQMQDLLLANPGQHLSEIVIKDVIAVHVDASLDEVSDLFDKYDFYGIPVIDDHKKLIGILRRKNVLEAINERAAYEHLETQGIVGGDELRTMPVFLRSRRRLSWLSVNILLNIIAASVIAFYQDTLSTVIALAVFLPIISDMSGCSGNQAVAVSMRELSLGTVKPTEMLRVWFQEISVGLINGFVLGILIGLAAYLWKGSVYLGLVVGGALAVNTIVAVSIGGTVPLFLKKMNVDPALASGPILTTITDMIGFFLALSFATIMISQLGGL
ncbi:MAG: magnesium transporter [Bacteroidales bacterium]|jgi:magnesium transporter|nr:magnesium transporter [Bacteroidales bacterium]